MPHTALGLLFALLCSGCATTTQTAAAPGCRMAPSTPSPADDQDCPNQTGNQIGVYFGGTVSYGMARAVR